MKRGRERLVSVPLAVFGALILAGAGASTGETQSGAATYAFAVKDTQDPCGLAFFSDHKGLIYEGKPLQ